MTPQEFKEFRRALKMTQRRMAELLGLKCWQWVSLIENGHRPISYRVEQGCRLLRNHRKFRPKNVDKIFPNKY